MRSRRAAGGGGGGAKRAPAGFLRPSLPAHGPGLRENPSFQLPDLGQLFAYGGAPLRCTLFVAVPRKPIVSMTTADAVQSVV